MTNNHQPDHRSAGVALPRLSDDAVVQIHEFIYFCLDLFETRYGDQIHRYYQDHSRHNSWEPQDPPEWGPGLEESVWTSPGPIPGKPTAMEIVCNVGAAVDLCSATPTHGFAVRAPRGLRRGAWVSSVRLKNGTR